MDTTPLTQSQLQLGKLTEPCNISHLIPISFVYDYLPRLPTFLKIPDWSVELPMASDQGEPDSTGTNSLPLQPNKANMPWHTSLRTARQNRHWRKSGEYASELCELLAADATYNNTKLARGGSLSSHAEKELRKPQLERYYAQATVLWPEADSERLSLIACGILLIVTFDDAGEDVITSDKETIAQDFVRRMRRHNMDSEYPASPLFARLDEIVTRCQQCDERTETDAGRIFIDSMLEWITYRHTAARFKTPREYLDYRWTDAANAWLIATCKFSIASTVSLQDPLIQGIVRLVGDHISIANDLASFDKEIAAFESGKTIAVTNLVQVMRESCGLTIEEAKSAAFVLQLLTEQKLEKELIALKGKGDQANRVHWQFIDSLLAMLAGHCFFLMTTSRYGGEAARISNQSWPS